MSKKPHNITNKPCMLERIREVYKMAIQWAKDMPGEEFDQLHTKISEGNSKIGKSLNVSIMPIVSCGCMGAVCGVICYAVRSLIRMGFNGEKWKKNQWVINTIIAMLAPDRYFEEIKSAIRAGLARRKKPIRYFRWHVGGEIISIPYLQDMVNIAKEFQEVRFLAFTKRYDIVNTFMDQCGGRNSIPENLSIIYSAAPGETVPNPYHLPECHINMADEKLNKVWRVQFVESQIWHCPGSCEECQCVGAGCWFLRDNTIVLLNQH